jgi:hypothetical protein
MQLEKSQSDTETKIESQNCRKVSKAKAKAKAKHSKSWLSTQTGPSVRKSKNSEKFVRSLPDTVVERSAWSTL